MGLYDFVVDRWSVLWFLAYQHISLVGQALILATAIALILGVLIYNSPLRVAAGNAVTAVGLTIPSYALLGVLVGIVGLGVLPSVIMPTFFGVFPILRNVVVGLTGVDKGLVESARGMGMSRLTTLVRLELPLAWPVIMTGVRVSAQMLMGIAAIVAFALGPGLGGYIFSGISRMGGANATNSIVAATIGILILAVILDTVLNVIARLTTPREIRA
ncbi:ABC transporter permease [Mycobacterium ulcerans]|uniref:ABC transporter permease n=2 Tax=Mycobacterium ulcerans TaxID=1809 RepID=A0PKE0_MYCUA|nr:ABC transporter permease [Mycobacterium ulcerans]ABL02809.1 ABC transporter permease [Mycobacterium ulcerans Agy99]MEB3904699.1 ABC transporter permease [Mycobacterium ulcerans]MEB3908505.1 ABC transporter permease [Mycobacterium ulcerans]MEB3918803.1 ABC transporter permease [Mycobacterium ulcerans]MEB3923172.1 ABC transporter permease [Mycobacterium ulcerans]